MSYTTDNLLSSIERKSFAPENQNTFSSQDIRSMADEITISVLVPNILAVREDYYVLTKDYTITVDQSEYLIPSRAIGMVLRDVQHINDSGTIRAIPRIELDDQVSTNSGSLYGYYIKDNKVVLHRTPNATTGTLRLSYFVEPGDLVLAASGAVISAINTSTKVVTVTSIPSTWTTGNVFDFISGVGGHSYRSIDNTSTLVSGNNITFSALPSDLAVGDYVNLAGESSVVQVPSPYRAALAQLVASEMLNSMNQPSGATAEKRAKQLLDSAQQLISPRVRGDVRYITTSNW